jgi:hypothetical protein
MRVRNTKRFKEEIKEIQKKNIIVCRKEYGVV